MSVTMKMEGFSDVDQELQKLSRTAGKGVLRRALKKSSEPLVERMKSGAPVDSGNLRNSITSSTKLASRQSRMHRRMFANDRSAVEFFVGPSYDLGAGGRHAHLLEFGTRHMSPQPFVRPAWDGDKMPLLDRVADNLKVELERSIARSLKRAKRLE